MTAYVLAIDFGTSFTTAATQTGDGSPELVGFGTSEGAQRRLPSVVLAREDGSLAVGWTADRQAAVLPERVVRAPKRLLGQGEPLLLGERELPVVEAAGAVIAEAHHEAERREGGRVPAETRLTHPASWGSARLDALRAAAGFAGIPDPVLVSEPVAAAIHYAAERLSPGELVAVYDLGGGTFDTAVLRRTAGPEQFEQVGEPGGREGLGGEIFDERLAAHLEERLRDVRADDHERLRASRRARDLFRREVRAAKEALSRATSYDATLPPGLEQESLHVTRAELEELIRDDVLRSVDILAETVESAGATPGELSAVYLAGGSSRIPLVSGLVHERLGLANTLDEPKEVVVLGAARRGAARTAAEREKPVKRRRDVAATKVTTAPSTAARAPRAKRERAPFQPRPTPASVSEQTAAAPRAAVTPQASAEQSAPAGPGPAEKALRRVGLIVIAALFAPVGGAFIAWILPAVFNHSFSTGLWVLASITLFLFVVVSTVVREGW